MHIIGFMMVYCRKNHVQSRAMHAREFCPKPKVAARVTQSRLTVPLHTSDLAFIFPHFHSYNLHYIWDWAITSIFDLIGLYLFSAKNFWEFSIRFTDEKTDISTSHMHSIEFVVKRRVDHCLGIRKYDYHSNFSLIIFLIFIQ